MSGSLRIIISIIVIMALGFSLHYVSQYHITDDESAIQSNLEIWLNRGPGAKVTPDVLKIKQLENTTSHIILYQLNDGDYGYAHLLKGLNGKFKIEHSGYGTGFLNSSYQVINTNKGTYLIMYGGNAELQIDHITAISQYGEYEFQFDVSENETFLQSAKIPTHVEQPFPAALSFYDNANNEME